MKRTREFYPDIKPSQIAFIDDKLENVKAAEEMGWKGIHFHAGKNSSAELVKALLSIGVDEAKEF
jgi:FMN phosphatase YigB (HAD superfamily)